jgi:ABC-type dipeptide/oligopeptide/nickel transport system permease component
VIIYAVRRLALAPFLAVAVAMLVFFVMRVLPGDPAVVMLGEDATPQSIAVFRQINGLDRPISEQALSYLGGLARGDLGTSMRTNRPVLATYLEVLPYTIDLILAGILGGTLLGVTLGILAARRRGSGVDRIVLLFSAFAISTPSFYLGLVLLLVFALRLDMLPALGAGDLSDIPARLQHLILPAVTLSATFGGRLARIMRAALLDVLTADYIRTARSKGLDEVRVLVRHGLRNALIPLVTVLGLYVAGAAAGSIIIEQVFTRPGVGRLLVGALASRDYPVIQSGLLIYALLVVTVNVVVDVTVAVVDPRVRLRR